MVSEKSKKGNLQMDLNHLNEIRAFKVHREIAFSNFDHFLNQTNL